LGKNIDACAARPSRMMLEVSEVAEKDEPVFSRNLELNPTPPGPSRKTPLPSVAQSELTAEDRRMYFRVEGGRILDLLGNELSRPEPDTASLALIGDLHRSWKALWQGDDSFPVGPFSELLEIACGLLSLTVATGRRMTSEEKLLFEDLKDNLSRLVTGEASIGCLQSSRKLIEKAAPLIESLKAVRAAGTARSAVKEPPARKPAGRETRPQPEAFEKPAFRRQSDISNAVDEWFDQVTRLMVDPGGQAGEKTPPAGASVPETGSKPAPSAKEESGRGTVPAPPDEGQFGLFPPSAGPLRKPGPRPVSRPPAPASGRTVRPGKLSSGPGPELPAKESAPPVEDRQSAPEIPPVPPLTPQAGRAPEPAGNKVESAPGTAPVPENVPVEVFAYFRECAGITAEVVRNNLSRIETGQSVRPVRLAAVYLDELLGLARDFGLRSPAGLLTDIRREVDSLLSAGGNREAAAFTRVTGWMNRFVEDLEKGCLPG
jgi:hypothetical protein